MKILKLYEDFNENIIFPYDDEYSVLDLTDIEEFEEFKDDLHKSLKDKSEEVLSVIGFENEDDWFRILNLLQFSYDHESLQENITSLKDFLSNFNSSDELNKIFKKK